MMQWMVLIIISGYFASGAMAQDTLRGRVMSDRGVPVEGVNIRWPQGGRGTFTDSHGDFVLPVELPGILNFTHLNYEQMDIWVTENKYLQVVLKMAAHSLHEVQVSRNSGGGQIYTSTRQLEEVPSILGEKDILKYLATMPGVVSRDILDPGIYVRGGSSTENVFMVNGTEVKDPAHLTGILSVFDPWILNRSVLYKSGFPVRYNNYLSAYLDMFPDTGDQENWKGEVSLGLLSSAFKVNGPLKRQSASFALAVRSSYLQYVAKMYNRTNKESPMPSYSFYDVTTALDSRISERLSMHVFGLFTIDRLGLEEGTPVPEQMKWRTFSANCRLSYDLENAGLEWKTGYRSGFTTADLKRNIQLGGGNKSRAWVSTLEYRQYICPDIQWNNGVKFEYEEFDYDGLKQWSMAGERYRLYTAFTAFYFTWREHWKCEAGLNYQYYTGKKNTGSWSPRFKLNWDNQGWNVWADYAKTVQYLALLPLLNFKSPVDVWCTLNREMQPARCHQYSMGMSKAWENGWYIYMALFWKKMLHLKDFDSVSLAENALFNERQTAGKGYARGAEWEIIYRLGRWSGRMNYTLSDSWRQFRTINDGKKFYPPYDIRHHVLLAFSVPVQRRLTMHATWTYASGMRTTFPAGIAIARNIHDWQEQPVFVPVYKDRYNFKLPDSHRLDVSVDYLRTTPRREWLWTVGVYNLYNRQNASFVYFKPEVQDKYYTRFIPYTRVLLPFVPYLSVTLKV